VATGRYCARIVLHFLNSYQVNRWLLVLNCVYNCLVSVLYVIELEWAFWSIELCSIVAFVRELGQHWYLSASPMQSCVYHYPLFVQWQMRGTAFISDLVTYTSYIFSGSWNFVDWLYQNTSKCWFFHVILKNLWNISYLCRNICLSLFVQDSVL